MISGMVRGGRCLDDGEPYIKAASHAAEFLSQEIYDPVSGILHRIHRNDRSTTEGFLDDYVYLICGLLDLYETTFQRRWLQWAEKLQNRQDERFLDSADGGYFTAAGDSSDVLMRLKEHVDGAFPSPNAVAADNLLRLHQLTGKSLYEQRLNALMQCFAAVLEAQRLACEIEAPSEGAQTSLVPSDGVELTSREGRKGGCLRSSSAAEEDVSEAVPQTAAGGASSSSSSSSPSNAA